MIKVDERWMWHKRIGHLIFYNMIKDNIKEAVKDMQNIIKPSEPICKHCQLGKKMKVMFKTKEYSTTRPLELVHTYLCGPIRNISIQGEHYFMLIIDDYTRMTRVYFLREKIKGI
jgi:hypothetical protein